MIPWTNELLVVQEPLILSGSSVNYETYQDVKHNVIESKRFTIKYHQKEYNVELSIR